MIKKVYNEFLERRERLLSEDDAMIQDVIEFNIDLLDSPLYNYPDIMHYLYIPMEDE